MALEQDIKAIEDEIRKTPYNKATQHHIGKLKAKLAKLKDEFERAETKRRGTAKAGYAVKKSGQASVGLVGSPNVGKSTLLNKITSAYSQIGDYDFTTINIVPGIMEYKGTKIQILDMPGLIEDASKGRGRGREVLSVARALDLIIFVLDAAHPEQLDILQNELYNANVRLNMKKPDITIKKKDRGGINVTTTLKLAKPEVQTVKEILSEFKYLNADIILRDSFNEERLIDFVAGNRAYIKGFAVTNKIDLIKDKTPVPYKIGNIEVIPISAKYGLNIDILKEKIFSELDFIRVYMKPQGKEVDYKVPLIVKRNSTVENICRAIHKDLTKKLRYAVVWGKSAKFNAQRVGLDHILSDEDVLTIVTSR